MRRSTLFMLLLSLLASGCAERLLNARTTDWVLIESANLRIRTNAGADRGTELARRYQRMRDALAEEEFSCAFDRLTAPVEVVVLARKDEIEWIYGPHWAGVYDPPPTALLGLQPQVVVSDLHDRQSVQTFVHELTHRLVASCYPTSPPWHREGTARFYETIRFYDDRFEVGFPAAVFMDDVVRPYGVPYQGEHILVLPLSSAPDFEELRTMGASEFYGARLGRLTSNYAAASVAINLFRFGEPSLRAPFRRYEQALADGVEDAEAWDAAFRGIDVESAYRGHLEAPTYGWRGQLMQVSEREVSAPRPMSQADAALLLAQLWNWYDERGAEEARTLMDLALTTSPRSGSAMRYLGAIAEATGQHDEALAWFSRALASSPDDPDTMATLLSWGASQTSVPMETTANLNDLVRRLVGVAETPFQLTSAARWLGSEPNGVPEALLLADQAIALDASDWYAHALAGECAEALGEGERALQAFRSAIALSAHASSDAQEYLRDRIRRLTESLGAP